MRLLWKNRFSLSITWWCCDSTRVKHNLKRRRDEETERGSGTSRREFSLSKIDWNIERRNSSWTMAQGGHHWLINKFALYSVLIHLVECVSSLILIRSRRLSLPSMSRVFLPYRWFSSFFLSLFSSLLTLSVYFFGWRRIGGRVLEENGSNR